MNDMPIADKGKGLRFALEGVYKSHYPENESKDAANDRNECYKINYKSLIEMVLCERIILLTRKQGDQPAYPANI